MSFGRPRFFHGTIEPIEGALHGGAYDNVLWTAREPAIAQTYMPASGSSALYSAPNGEWSLDEPVDVRRQGTELGIAEAMGYKLEVLSRDNIGPTSWIWRKDGQSVHGPRQGEILEFVRTELGYDVPLGGTVWVKTKIGHQGSSEYLHSSHKEPGQLFVLLPTRPLKCFDLAQGRDADLTDLDYHKIDLFNELNEKGFDVIRIHDFVQSPHAGNVPHISYGFLSKGLAAVHIYSMPASHHDWGQDFEHLDTNDFVSGHRAWVEDALSRGEDLPPDVLALYPEFSQRRSGPISALKARVAEVLDRSGRTRRPEVELSPEERERRRPLPPKVLLDAKQDAIHRDVGRCRAAKSVRIKRD